MTKVALIIVLLICSILCWLFATTARVNNEHNKTAFIIKSIFYWLAITIAFSIGYLISSI